MAHREGTVAENHSGNAVHQHIDGPIRQALKGILPAAELERAEEMVSRFSADGQVAASSVLIYAHAKNKLGEAMRELEQEWRRHFGSQPAETRGSPSYSDNMAHFAMVYDRIGVMPPWEERR